MPVTPDTAEDSQRCVNPNCNGVAVIVPGSHNPHGTNEWWKRRARQCPACGWKFKTVETVIPGSIEVPAETQDESSAPEHTALPDPQRRFCFDLSQ